MGHVPRLISAACLLFLRIEINTIKCRIMDSRRYSADLPSTRRSRNFVQADFQGR